MTKHRSRWAWAKTRDSESWIGFPSRAKAERMDGSPVGYVAPCVWPDPAAIAMNTLDADELLERMEEGAEEFWSEDPLFELRNREAAHRALAKLIGAWAKRYVRATAFTVDREKAEAVLP